MCPCNQCIVVKSKHKKAHTVSVFFLAVCVCYSFCSKLTLSCLTELACTGRESSEISVLLFMQLFSGSSVKFSTLCRRLWSVFTCCSVMCAAPVLMHSTVQISSVRINFRHVIRRSGYPPHHANSAGAPFGVLGV